MTRKSLTLFCMLLMMLSFTGMAFGSEQLPDSESPGAFERFGRGIINVVSSPLELPAQMYTQAVRQQKKSSNPFGIIAAYTGGVLDGIVMFPKRLASGLYDVFTFPFERCNKCLVSPEYVTLPQID